MQDFNTIIGVIQMRQNECSFSVIQKRYHIGSGTTQRILSRFEASGLTLEELRQMDPHIVEELIYPPKQVRRKDIPLPDFQYYYDRIHAKGIAGGYLYVLVKMESITTPHCLFNRSVFALKPACGTSFGCFGLDC